MFLVSCNEDMKISRYINHIIKIYPDYTDITIPYNIAPLNFSINWKGESCLILDGSNDHFQVKSKDGHFIIPSSKWKDLIKRTSGCKIKLTICIKKGEDWWAYKPFFMEVAKEPIDKYIVYRLIPPGYELWNQMGIYQRNLENYDEIPIYENKLSGNNCINCHSFCMQDPNRMLFHARGVYGGTFLIENGKIERLNTKTSKMISPLVYPSWHPSGKYIAFSVNNTQQSFHINSYNRIEVYDTASDVVVYDVKNHCIISSSLLESDKAYETFPTFSPCGRYLYFCSAHAVDSMPQKYKDVKYSLCKINFDQKNHLFGTHVDTIYNAVKNRKSVSFPRVSPNGKFLVFTLQNYGNFSIWHKDSDLYMLNLINNNIYPLVLANSNDVESYHSWSHNSRWLIFSSRRMDGLYTRLFISYIDSKGMAHKPFLIPQKDAIKYYKDLMFSYNIPEFVTNKEQIKSYDISNIMKNASAR